MKKTQNFGACGGLLEYLVAVFTESQISLLLVRSAAEQATKYRRPNVEICLSIYPELVRGTVYNRPPSYYAEFAVYPCCT